MKFIFLGLWFISHSLLASDCSPVNLVTQKKSPFNSIPVYDQDGSSICYAYSGAQLLDYELIKTGRMKTRSIHPLWAALKNSEARNQDHVASGVGFFSVNKILETSNCPYPVVAKALNEWALKANVKEGEIINLIEKFGSNLKKKLYDKKAKLSQNEINQAITQAITDHQPFCSPNATLDKLIPDLKKIAFINSQQMFQHLVLPQCKDKLIKHFMAPAHFFRSFDENDYTSKIVEKLDRSNSPVSMSYCATVLGNQNYVGLVKDSSKNLEMKLDDCRAHESLIVGKKKIENSCHFLLRNSWGSGFFMGSENAKCLCRHRITGALVDDCNRNSHNNGFYTVEGCWIDSVKVSKNIYGLSYFENTAPQVKKK